MLKLVFNVKKVTSYAALTHFVRSIHDKHQCISVGSEMSIKKTTLVIADRNPGESLPLVVPTKDVWQSSSR